MSSTACNVPVLPTVFGNTPRIRDGFRPPNPCNPQTWAASLWHHVQIAVHTTGNGNVYYDFVTVDGKTTQFSGMYGNSSRSGPWTQGLLSLNFQLDGINNGEKETTITAYTDGFTMIYW